MIQQAIAIGGGGGDVELYNPTRVALSNSNATATLSGVNKKPLGIIHAYSDFQGAIIYDSVGNEVVNFYGYMYTLTTMTLTYDANAKTATVTIPLNSFQDNQTSNWYVLQ